PRCRPHRASARADRVDADDLDCRGAGANDHGVLGIGLTLSDAFAATGRPVRARRSGAMTSTLRSATIAFAASVRCPFASTKRVSVSASNTARSETYGGPSRSRMALSVLS